MVTGEAGRMFLVAHIPVEEVRNIESECVTAPVRALVVNGVLETQQNLTNVTQIHVQVNVKAVVLKHLEDTQNHLHNCAYLFHNDIVYGCVTVLAPNG